MSKLSRLILATWPVVLGITLLLSALSLPRTLTFFKTISTDTADLLPTTNPNVQTLFKLRQKLEKGVKVSLIVESDDPEATLRFLTDVSHTLSTHPLVKGANFRKKSYTFIEDHKLLYATLDDLKTLRDRLDRRIQTEKLGNLYIDFTDEKDDLSFEDLKEKYASRSEVQNANKAYYASEDGKIYSLSIEMKGDSSGLKDASAFQDAMQTFTSTLKPETYHPSMKIYFLGTAKVIEYRALMSDLKKIGVISGILLFIPLFIRFRNLAQVGLIFFPLIAGLPISLAFSTFFVPKLTISTSFLFSILGGLGIESGIHIFTRYAEAKAKGNTLPQILDEIYGPLGRSVLTSVLSVSVTFLLLTQLNFRGFSEFGLIAGSGLLILFIIYFSFFPALLILIEKIRRVKHVEIAPEPIVVFKVNPVYFRPLLILFAVCTLYSLMAAPNVDFEFDSKKIRADIPSIQAARAKQRLTVDQVSSPAMLLLDSKDEANTLKTVLEQKIATKQSTLSSVNSYYDLVPDDQPEKMAVIQEIKTLLDDPALVLVKGEKSEDLTRFKEAIAKAKPFTKADIPEDIVKPIEGRPEIPGYLFFIRALPKLELDDGKNAMRFAGDIAHLSVDQKTYYPASDSLIYGLVLKSMLNDAPKVLIVSLLSVAFFVFIDFRNAKKTAIILLSIVTGVLWLFGLMALFGIKLNFYNIIIVPAVMGMSIDNSIHLFHRYQELGRGSVPRVLSSTGIAALLASLTNATGFFGLLFCTHQGLYSIGLLAVIGIATCLISTLIFLPIFLQQLETWKRPAI